jgi:hypothetical protein
MGQVEHRHTPRLSIRIPVRCEGPAVPYYRTLAFTRDVSRGGLQVEATRLAAPGTTISLRLLAGTRIAHAEAAVIWAWAADDSPGRMGLKITRMDEEDLRAWEDLLAYQGAPTPRASLRIPLDLEVTCVVPPDTGLAGRVENVSEGGLLVFLPRNLPPRTLVKVVGPDWLVLPPVEAEVVWVRDQGESTGVLHGLRILASDAGKELFVIGAILRSFMG